MPSSKLLISGFEPFGQHLTNLTQDYIRQRIPCPNVLSVVLPVVFEKSWILLSQYITEFKPTHVMMLGLAENRHLLSWERTAVNWQSARIKDNAGNQPMGSKIDHSQPDGLFASLPPWHHDNKERVNNHEWESSWSAGTFVCNDLFFRALSSPLLSELPTSFIHVPGRSEHNHDEIFKSIDGVIKIWTGL